METFKYTALSASGEKVSGVIEGFNEMDAAARLKEQYSIVMQLKPASSGGAASKFLSANIGGNKLNGKAFTMMCTQFSVILKAGIPITRTVHLIAAKMTDKPLKHILEQVAADVEAGRSLSASFTERGKKMLPVTFLETIRAGEEAGNLDTAFESVSQHYTKQTKIKGKVKGALIYPIFVLIIAVVVVIVLMVKVVPTFTEIFDSYGAELPLITQILIGMSDFFRDYIWLIGIIIAAFVVVYKIYGSTETGRLKLAKGKLKMPVLGNINILNSASQFANTMAMMLNAGLPLTKSVNITSRVITNYYISQEVGKITAELEVGHTMGKCLRDSGCLPEILVDMTAVGEESGELASTMSLTASYYDDELEQATAAALAKLEPAVLVFMGGLAGFIVAAIYIAMFDMYGAM